LENKGLIDIIETVKHEHVCDSCQFKKLSRLLFSHSKQSSYEIFEKTHCDMWGLAPILSMEKFKYYARLVEDFSKYTWIIPLQHMFDFSNAYLAFENYVSRQFNKHIKVFHSNRGAEFINSKLSSCFSQQAWFIRLHAIILQNKQV